MHIIGNGRLWARNGDGYVMQWKLGYRRHTKLHLVDGEHAFQVPPEAVIRTHARLEY